MKGKLQYQIFFLKRDLGRQFNIVSSDLRLSRNAVFEITAPRTYVSSANASTTIMC